MIVSGLLVVVFFFKQKTAYEMRISDWSSDVCSSDLPVGDRAARVDELLQFGEIGGAVRDVVDQGADEVAARHAELAAHQIGRLNAVGDFVDRGDARVAIMLSSEEGRVGKSWVSTCRSGCERYH